MQYKPDNGGGVTLREFNVMMRNDKIGMTAMQAVAARRFSVASHHEL
jgi:hypothetical protein